MLPIKKWAALLFAAVLAFSVIAGCGTGKDKDAQADQDAAQGQKGENTEEENPVPLVNVDLGMKPEEIVAEYNGKKVTVKDFEDYLEIQAFINPQAGYAINEKNPEALKMFVSTYVGELMMEEKAPQVEDLEKQAEDLKAQILGQYSLAFGGDEKKLKKHMEDQGISDEDLLGFLVRYKKVEAYLRSQMTEEELKKQYEEGKAEGAFTIASVRHILIATENRSDEEAKKLADELVQRLRKGEDFAKLAKEHTDDPGSKETGGLYENVPVNNWVPEFKKAAIELPLNEISDPVKTDYGYHIMRVESRGEKTFEDAKPELEAQFINEKYDSFLDKEVADALKKINLPHAD